MTRCCCYGCRPRSFGKFCGPGALRLSPRRLCSAEWCRCKMSSCGPIFCLRQGCRPGQWRWRPEVSQQSRPRSHSRWQGRQDFPRQPAIRRASMQAALEAARPENLVRTLAALDEDILACTAVASNTCRVRLYEALCRIAEQEAWPIRIFAGCLKQGRYKSVKVYFSAIVGHQIRMMGVAPTPDLQRCIADATRSALRGSGPSKLKDHFHVPVLLATISDQAGSFPFDPERPDHTSDVMLICAWWMLREIESSAAQVGHVTMSMDAVEVTLMLPVQKNDTRGQLCCRTLRCACRAARQALCPFHAMKRHLQRRARKPFLRELLCFLHPGA